MIQERNMKQAKRVDNVELCVGYLYVTHNGEYEIGAYDSELNIERITHIVDPATVEDVAVKPIIGENGNIYCPNCENKIGAFRDRNYCPDCGQRIAFKA